MMTLLALHTLNQKGVLSEDDLQEVTTQANEILDAFKPYTVKMVDRTLTTFKSHVTSLHTTLSSAGVFRQMNEWNVHGKGIQKCLISYMKQVKIPLMFTLRNADCRLQTSTCPQQNNCYLTSMLMDQCNYGRWGPLYVSAMLEMQTADPDTWTFPVEGNVVISKHGVPFTAIDPDHPIKQEHTNMKVKGGFVGITGNEQAMENNFIIAPSLCRLVY